MAGKNGKEHRHDWQQSAATLQMGKVGRVTGVAVRWRCAKRGCGAETVTEANVRRPAANARPRAESPLSAREVKAAVQRGKDRLRERNAGSLAAMAAEADLDELTAEDFAPPAGDGKRTGNAEERRNAIEFFMPTFGEILQDPAQARKLGV